MSLLTLIQNAADALGVPRPTTVIDNTDGQVRQLLALANVGGKELAARGDWAELQREQTFTTVAQAAQTDAIPADFDRFLNGSMYNRTTNRKVHGPIDAQQWQREQANPSVSVAEDFFRVRGSDLLITPTPAEGETIAYEYITEHWCESSEGAGRVAFAADTDTTVLDEELHRLDLIWRYKQAKGLDYAEDMATFERKAERSLGKSGGAPLLGLTTRRLLRPTLYPNVPDGNFPSS